MCDSPHSRNAFLVQLVGPRRAQRELEEMERLHPAGALVRVVRVCAPHRYSKQPEWKENSPPFSSLSSSVSLASLLHLTLLLLLLSAAHMTSVPPPAFFFSFCFGPTSFLFFPLSSAISSPVFPPHPLFHFYTFLTSSCWFLFFFLV